MAEKVFAFQILTESVSAAYCEWRLAAFPESEFTGADSAVAFDEKRHLSMGRSMLAICDKDEASTLLTTERKRALVREINAICFEALITDMAVGVYGTIEGAKIPAFNSLNCLISKTVLKESGVSKGVLQL